MQDIRWKQRFNSFENAFKNFSVVHEALTQAPDNIINKMAVIQAFEITIESAWKLLKDYLEYNFVLIKEVYPKKVIKEAFAAEIIENGELWIDMLKDRNSTSHEYNEEESNKIIGRINTSYFEEIKRFYEDLKGRINE